MKKISFRHRVEYWGFLLLNSFIPHVSRTVLRRIADQAGIIMYLASSRRRKIARKNLDIAFGEEKSGREKDDIILASFQNLIFFLLDSIWLSRNLTKSNWKQYFDVEGEELMRQAAKRGRGIIAPVSHFGNWEIMGVLIGFLDVPAGNYVMRRLDNPFINEYTVNFRSGSGNRIIYKDEAMKKILAALRRNEAVGIVFDQNAIKGRVFVDFFGIPAATTKSVAAFALASEAAVIPTTCYMLSDLRYRIVFGPELECRKTGKFKDNVSRFTLKCNQFIEEYIKKEPQFYLWGHRRFKERPPGEPKVYT
jgi:KDO2-lipid IV(A) lauroyltransferase